MRLEYPFCVFESHFSDEFCDRIIEIGEALDPIAASVAYDPDNNLRYSTVSWIRDTPESSWVYNQLTDFVFETNRLYWGWKLSEAESVQYTRYGPGQYYTWHADQRRKAYDQESRWPGMIRKVTIAIALSNDGDFTGGDFCIEELNSPPDAPDRRVHVLSDARKRGSAIVFPSSLYHRVNPVETGLRRSLVAWFVGPPYV